jgi:hypothetical protein
MAEAPENTPFLGMGRPTFDRASFEADGLSQSLIDALMHIQGFMAACGYAGAAEAGQTQYQNVVARYDDPDWVLYGARPDTPLTPDVIPGLAGGGEITVEENNSVIVAAATILNFSSNFDVTDAGGGQADIDVTVGSGTTYTASTPLVIDGSDDISLQFGFGLNQVTSTLVADIGDGLEADSNKFRVKAHTYIDVTSDGVAVDLTEVASYNGAGDQYLRNNAGTLQWATLPNWSISAGLYIDVSGQSIAVDLTEVPEYSSGLIQLLGHDAGDEKFQIVAEWMKSIEGYLDDQQQYLKNDSGTIKWVTALECDA